MNTFLMPYAITLDAVLTLVATLCSYLKMAVTEASETARNNNYTLESLVE